LFVRGAADAEWYSRPGVKEVTPTEVKPLPVDQYLHLLRKPTPEEQKIFQANKAKAKQGVAENFADGNSIDMAEGAQNNLPTIIQSFVNSSLGQKYKQYDCKTVTRAFVQWAEQNKIPTQVVSLAPPSADFIAKNPKYKGKSGQGDGHIMPIVNGNAIDFTVRQFGVSRPFDNPLVTPTNSLPAVYGRFGYFTDKPEWFLGGKSHWIGPLSSIPSEIFNQNFGDEMLEQGVAEGEGGLGQTAGIGMNGKQFNFSIKDLIAKAQNYPIKKINPQLFVKQLADRHEDPKQTVARAQAADLQYPIIVVQDGNTLMIADGTHRAQKAIMNKLPSINAHVIPVEDMAEFSKQGVAEGATQLSVQQLATISDEALDNAYHYGRSQPGNTFGWQANLKSASFAKQMIDKGVTDIEQISNAIHKGWNVTAQAFVKNPQMFDDSKTMSPEKLQAKIAQRQKLMTQNYAELPEDEKEKDRVVARAMLQAIKGQQGVAEGTEQRYRIYFVVPEHASLLNLSSMPTTATTIVTASSANEAGKKFKLKVPEAHIEQIVPLNHKQGVAEGHADQQRRVFKKNGKPVGEVGIDRESSPGVGQYYMKHYASGKDLAGYDSYEEAVAELKHYMKQGVAESAKSGEYYIHTVYFKDGTKKRVRVTSDEFDVADYYTKRGQAVDRVDYDFQIHSDMTEQSLDEKQDACYNKVKSRYKVWPSAYASGALVQCRKKGADNWGEGGKKK
jgi:hypothetical protein